jgi:hypothetical protein
MAFELCDVPRGRGGGQAQMISRFGKAPQFNDLGKNSQRREAIHTGHYTDIRYSHSPFNGFIPQPGTLILSSHAFPTK